MEINFRWPRTRSPAKTRRDEARYLNRIIDRALLQPTMQHLAEVLSSAKQWDTPRLAERIRRRATWLTRHERPLAQQLLTHRDQLIMALYANLAPEGWASAWCDGSSTGRASERHAGIAAVLMDASGNCLSRFSRYVGNKNVFDAELAALAAVLEAAVTFNLEQLRVHTDSKALVQLWHEQRDDPRLAALRPLAAQFKGLQILAIPRLHNQVAHVLAKQAVKNGVATSPEENQEHHSGQ